VRRSGVDHDGKQLYRPITANTINKTAVVLLRRVLRRARDNWNATILREPIWKKHLLKQIKRPIREITPPKKRNSTKSRMPILRTCGDLRSLPVCGGTTCW
jgi:hypothetical protein